MMRTIFSLKKAQRYTAAVVPAHRFVSGINSASAKFEDEVTGILRGVIEPATNRSIDSLGILQGVKVKDNIIKIALDFFVPGYPFEKEVVKQIRRSLEPISWSKGVKIQLEEPKKFASLNSVSIAQTTLTNVGHIIGVSSCKGGVGKSTIASNLAVTLSNMGLKVGLLDADVYGPSLPLILPEVSPVVQRSPTNPKNVLPLRAAHCPELKMLSFGHVNPKSGAPGSGGKAAAVVRGPIATRILNQLLLATEWGDLDYLVVDMPPGTGDIQITLSQSACLSGAVVVTTPHALSLVDAAKGVAMFEELKVPTLAVVENMSYFMGDDGKKYFPFGRGGRENLLKGCGILQQHSSSNFPTATSVAAKGCASHAPHEHNDACGAGSGVGVGVDRVQTGAAAGRVENESFQRLQECPLHSLPLYTRDSVVGTDSQTSLDAALPICVTDPDSLPASVYAALARDVVLEVFKNQVSALLIPSVSYSKSRGVLLLRYFTASQAVEYSIPASELRLRDPMTGLPRPPLPSISGYSSDEPFPTTLDLKGQYGVSIVWSDGHFADIYPYDVLRKIALDIASSAKVQE